MHEHPQGTPSLFDDEFGVSTDAQPVGERSFRQSGNRPEKTPQPTVGKSTEASLEKLETVLAVDGNSLIHRAYHAYSKRSSDVGQDDEVGAGLYGFLALLAATVDMTRPDSVVVGLDSRESNFRKRVYPDYKAQRPDKAPALDELLDVVPSVLDELGVYTVCHADYEADDVCGSVAAAAARTGRRCIVATSDRDSFALVNDTTSVFRIRSGMHRAQVIDSATFRSEIGVEPGQYTEFAAMRGDTSDNLSGVPGIGPKRGQNLLAKFPNVAAAVADPMGCRSVLGPSVGQALLDDVASDDSVFRRNVNVMTIVQDLPLDVMNGRPDSNVGQIEEVLRRRRLAGLITRMTMCFADLTHDSPPPLTDADAPPLPDGW